ncbi:MAG TPA: MEKHLA domain-containing protein [Candidatus Limnocylindria bacterium]|nr:MEKHLA domain-containing protein [Candidatus Limnocylindria bacterium]
MSHPWYEASAVSHVQLLAQAYRHWFGMDLVVPSEGQSLAEAYFTARIIIVSHGTQPDPVLNYGNQIALQLWEMDWATLTRTPSRYTAEAPDRAERARLLEAVTRDGYIKNYAGIRVSSTGRRFRIERATVWNLLDTQGVYRGQAATFSHWDFI